MSDSSADSSSSNWLHGSGIKELVSVIIPTYNRHALLGEALYSIYKQSYRPIEVIVIDDGSEDCIKEIAGRWVQLSHLENSFFIRFFKQTNRGPSAARNLGLQFCRGEFIQFLDSDDILLPDKLKDSVEIFVSDADVDMVYSERGEFYSDYRDFWPWERQHADLSLDPSAATVVLSSVSTPLPLFSRELLRKAGPWNERLWTLEDWEYIGRVASWTRKARSTGKIQVLCRAHEGARLSVRPWGEPTGVQSGALASAALFPLVVACDSPRKVAAIGALAKRSLSCLRVAVVAGHIVLAREILAANHLLLAAKRWSRSESWLWRGLLYLPDGFLYVLFRLVRAVKVCNVRRRMIQARERIKYRC